MSVFAIFLAVSRGQNGLKQNEVPRFTYFSSMHEKVEQKE